MGLAAEQRVALLLLRCELRFLCQHRVEFRGKARHLRGRFVAGDRHCHLIETRGGHTAIARAQMNRRGIVCGRWPGRGTNLLNIRGPSNSESLCSPHAFEQRPIRPLRSAIDRAGKVGKSHFHRIGRRSFGLLGRGIAQASPGRSHVPEVSADKVALPRIVVENGRERRKRMGLRPSIAKPRAHRARIRAGGTVQLGNRAGESCQPWRLPRLGWPL